jgi:suppressor of ftsI
MKLERYIFSTGPVTGVSRGLGILLFGVVSMLLAHANALLAEGRALPKPSSLRVAAPTKILKVVDDDTIELTAGFVKQKFAGKWITRLAYNGMIPGPIIVAKQGSKLKLKLVNKTGEPTSLHSHGLRVDDRNDGVVGIGQEPIPNNGSHTYDLKFPDSGIFWYHPHLVDEYGQEMGLQGNYWVTNADLSQMPRANADDLVVIDDLLIEDGEMPQFKTGKLSYALMGRYGNINLINNKSKWTSTTKVGSVVRYWITNTANARPFKLKFSGAQMKVIGSDSGLYAKDLLVDDLILAPSERAIVDVFFSNQKTVLLENVGPQKKQLLGKIFVTKNPSLTALGLAKVGSEFASLMVRKELEGDFKPLLSMAAAKPDFTMKIDATLRGEHAEHVMNQGVPTDGIEWEDSMPEMNAALSDKEVTWRVIDPDTGKENMAINWLFTKNKPVKIRIINDGKHHPMQHPMHFHGQRFIVLARNGVPEVSVGWKDTVLVRAGETVDVVLDNQNPGKWMGHCHISEHLGTGMMFGFEVH